MRVFTRAVRNSTLATCQYTGITILKAELGFVFYINTKS